MVRIMEKRIEWGSSKAVFGVGGHVAFLIAWLGKFSLKRWLFIAKT